MINTIDANTLDKLGLRTNKEVVNKANENKNSLGQDQFLELMVTQIQNQDPFKPMENGDFLAQIAQFGTVSGIQDLQKTFESLSTSLISSQAMQASTLVGRNIVVPTENFNHSSGKKLNGLVDLTSATNSLSVDILDASNQVIDTVQLGPQQKGLIEFTWDGMNNKDNLAVTGSYKMVARAQLAEGDVAMSTLVNEKVKSVSIGNTQEGLLINTVSKSTYSFNQVRQVQ